MQTLSEHRKSDRLSVDAKSLDGSFERVGDELSVLTGSHRQLSGARQSIAPHQEAAARIIEYSSVKSARRTMLAGNLREAVRDLLYRLPPPPAD
jgi:hypothetical protein